MGTVSEIFLFAASCLLLSTTSAFHVARQPQWVIDAFVDQLIKDTPDRHPELLDSYNLSDDKVEFDLLFGMKAEASLYDILLKGYHHVRRNGQSNVITLDGRDYVTAPLSIKNLVFDANADVNVIGIKGKEVKITGSIEELQLEVSFYPKETRGEVSELKVTELKGFDVKVHDSGVLEFLTKSVLMSFKSSLEKKFQTTLNDDLLLLFKQLFL